MNTFKDTAGRLWTIAVNAGTVKRVREMLNVDLADAFKGDLLLRLYRDPMLICDVVYAACKPEADAAGVSDSDFARAMAGDAISDALQAILAGMQKFPINPERRDSLAAAIDKMNAISKKAMDGMVSDLRSLNVDEILAASKKTKKE